MKWLIKFRDEKEEYIAFGNNPDLLPVYKIIGKEVLIKQKMTFPACERFMPYVDFGELIHGPDKVIDNMVSKEFKELPE